MKENEQIEKLRHSLAHLLAAAVLEFYPDTKLTIGPAIQNGFYYDFDFSSPISQDELPKIEEKMRELLPSWKEFSHKEVSESEAKEIFMGNPYKLELINEIVEKGEKITLYTAGDFTDLCRGGHLENPSKEIDPEAFKLDRLAGAYWRGNEKNKMLTRIYGLAFESKKELDEYLAQREEAEKRDHKRLGKELDLFLFSHLVGSGLPLWSPKGTTLRDILDDFVWRLRKRYGYERVDIPHITKKDLYEKSGHWSKFGDELFKITTRENHEFVMKPMNCPHHIQIYDRKKWSYKELPQRYASTTKCYRDEQTGELSGLSRARSFTQDDAHVFCRMTDAKEEFLNIWEIVQNFYKAFGFVLKLRLSLHDPKHPEKYLGNPESWDKAENILREIANEKNIDFYEGIGEAAFYGPKFDFMAMDSMGREWQVATIQLDINMPEQFDLSCVNEEGEKERIIMIHAAIMGSIERFLSILIEHYGGAFPSWLSPVQARILPIGENQNDFGKQIYEELEDVGIRVELDDSNESLGKKIRDAKLQKIPYVLVIGDKEIKENKFTLESRDKGKLGLFETESFVKLLKDEDPR